MFCEGAKRVVAHETTKPLTDGRRDGLADIARFRGSAKIRSTRAMRPQNFTHRNVNRPGSGRFPQMIEHHGG